MRPEQDDFGSEKTFGLRHPEQMLEKLAWEQSLASDDKIEARFQVFAMLNAFGTAWHLIEWTWEALGPITRQRLGTETPADYRSRVMRQCPELALCQQLGNGGKHRRLTRFNNPGIRSKIDYVVRLRRRADNRIETMSFTATPSIYQDDLKLDPLHVIGIVSRFWASEFEALRNLQKDQSAE